MDLKYLHFSLVAIIAIGDQISCQVDPDKTLDTEDGYRIERFDTVIKDYDSAQGNCGDRGILYVENAWVVRIKDSIAQGQIENILSNTTGDYFIGLNYHDGDWYWNDETQLTTKNWEKNEGDDADENCAYIAGNNGMWFDIPCDTSKAFICQSNLIYIEAKKTEIILLEGSNVTLSAVVATQEDPVIGNLYKLPNVDTSLQSVTATTSQILVSLNYPIYNLNPSMHAGEYVFVVTTQTPNTYNRTSTTKLSVHVPVTIDNIEPYSIRSPVTTGPEYVHCSAKGIPPPEVKWERAENNTEVSLNETIGGVYQTIESSKAILHIGNASGEDHGSYTCVAKNYVTTSNILEEVTDNITLTVLSSPSIDECYGNECGDLSSITVIWRPGENTWNVCHAVNVTDTNNSVIYTEMIQPSGQKPINTSITNGLIEGTTYKVEITVCPDLCIPHLSNSTYATTAVGVPNRVTNATVDQEDDECIINWEWAGPYSKNDVSFVVQERVFLIDQNTEDGSETTALQVSNCNNSLLWCSEESYETVKPMKLNRKYNYTVATRTCSGDSEEMVAVGECVTDRGAPETVTPPMDLGRNGDYQQIRVTEPDETNGIISCIFVVLVKESDSVPTTEFNEATLEKFSNAAVDANLENNVEYLAVAIRRSTINESGLVLNLGDKTRTSCNPENITKSRMDKYAAVNRELEKDISYTYYTLTSTPYREKENAAFGRSDLKDFKIDSSTNYVVPVKPIVGGTLGGLGIIVIIVGSIYYFKVIRPKNQEESTDTTQDGDDQVDSGRNDIWNVATIATVKNPSTLMPSSNPAYKHDPQPGIAPENHSPTTIHKQQMRQKFEELNKNKGKEFETQFKEIKRNAAALTLSSDIASNETRKKKNRYKNVLPYDNTRVKLKGTVQDDYINACYINGHHAINKFIATQGPTDATIEDFWKMVAGERTKVIVMLTNVVEAGKRKCQKYWPDISQEFTKYGDVSVTNTKETYYGGFMKRTFRIKTPDVGHDRTVEQLQYLKWPDHGIPVTTSSFVRLHKGCVKSQAGADVPIIVHCSAGAGRTGTFIGYDYLLEELGANSDFDVYNCVTKMREQRMDMVQTCGQYKLLHRLLLEEVLFGNTDSDESQFNTKYPSDERAQKSLAQEEFKKVEEASSIPKILENEVKDFEVIIRWYPEERENIARYDASYVENYYNEKKVIAARSPVNEHDRELFWRVVLDNEVKYIVMLDTKKPVPYWPQQNGEWIKFGKITVGLTESHDHRHTIERRFGVTGEGIEQEVVQYQMVKWSPDVIKNTIEKVTGAVNTAMRSRSKVVVHCCNGRGRTGTFCASINLLERLSKENHVDVFRAVKDLRDCRDGMVQNESQYRMCYKTIAHSMNTKAAATYAGLGDEASQGTSMIQDEKQNREAYENHSVYSKKSTTKV